MTTDGTWPQLDWDGDEQEDTAHEWAHHPENSGLPPQVYNPTAKGKLILPRTKEPSLRHRPSSSPFMPELSTTSGDNECVSRPEKRVDGAVATPYPPLCDMVARPPKLVVKVYNEFGLPMGQNNERSSGNALKTLGKMERIIPLEEEISTWQQIQTRLMEGTAIEHASQLANQYTMREQ